MFNHEETKMFKGLFRVLFSHLKGQGVEKKLEERRCSMG